MVNIYTKAKSFFKKLILYLITHQNIPGGIKTMNCCSCIKQAVMALNKMNVAGNDVLRPEITGSNTFNKKF